MRPSEALERAITRAAVIDHKPTPGAVIERCPPDVRDALADLTSKDVDNVRIRP